MPERLAEELKRKAENYSGNTTAGSVRKALDALKALRDGAGRTFVYTNSIRQRFDVEDFMDLSTHSVDCIGIMEPMYRVEYQFVVNNQTQPFQVVRPDAFRVLEVGGVKVAAHDSEPAFGVIDVL